MSKPNGHGKTAAPDNETSDARFPLPRPLPQAGEGDKDSLREFHVNCHSRAEIPEHLMLSRLAQSEQMRECFIRQDERSRASFFRMWIQNPALAKQGGSKVQNLLSPLAVANAEEMGSGTNSLSSAGSR
jgi:hypothetical protein